MPSVPMILSFGCSCCQVPITAMVAVNLELGTNLQATSVAEAMKLPLSLTPCRGSTPLASRPGSRNAGGWS